MLLRTFSDKIWSFFRLIFILLIGRRERRDAQQFQVRSYLYNGGKGKLIAIAELVKIRNKQRNAMLGALRRKKGRGEKRSP